MEEDSRDTSAKRPLEAGDEEVAQRKKASGRRTTKPVSQSNSYNIENSEQAVSAPSATLSSSSSSSVYPPMPYVPGSESGPSIFQSIWSWFRNLGGKGIMKYPILSYPFLSYLISSNSISSYPIYITYRDMVINSSTLVKVANRVCRDPCIRFLVLPELSIKSQ